MTLNELQVFNNPEFGDIRALLIENEPWWIGKEIAKALGYENTRKAISDHIDKEDKGVTKCDTPGGMQSLTIINESGLYSLILSSKLPTAKKFKRWITSEVLPALRKSGKYEIKAEDPEPAEQRQLTVDDYIRAASIIAGCRNERMPIVIALLKNSGMEIPKIEDIERSAETASDYDETGETAILINEAINDYGMSMTEIGKLCGLQATQISRIRTGQGKVRKSRAKIIQKAIKHELEQRQKAI